MRYPHYKVGIEKKTRWPRTRSEYKILTTYCKHNLQISFPDLKPLIAELLQQQVGQFFMQTLTLAKACQKVKAHDQ